MCGHVCLRPHMKLWYLVGVIPWLEAGAHARRLYLVDFRGVLKSGRLLCERDASLEPLASAPQRLGPPGPEAAQSSGSGGEGNETGMSARGASGVAARGNK